MSTRLVAALIGAITIIMICALDIYIPATPYLSDVFSVTDYVMKMTFLMGPLAGLVISIPIGNYSDLYGRRPIMVFCMILFLIGALLCTLSNNIESFFLGRLILSIGSAGLNVLCGTILSDLFKGVQLAKYLGIYSSIFPVVFALAPIIGAQILTHFGWRYIFFTLIVGMGILLPLVIKFLPETRVQETRSGHSATSHQEMASLMSRLIGLITKPTVVALAVIHSLPIAINGIFVVNSPFLFIETFHFGPVAFSIIQAIPIIFQFLGAVVYRFSVHKIGTDGSLRFGIMTTGAFMLAGVMTLFQWIPQDPYFIIAVLSLFSFGATFLISSAATLLLDAHSYNKGLAMSIMVLIRNGSIFFILSTASWLADDTIYPIFGSMVAIAIVLLVLIYNHLSFQEKTEQSKN